MDWLTDLDASGCLGIGFGGGEPTLHPDFSTLCQHTAATTGLAVTFTTHGHWINESLLSDLNGSVHFVRISMDGVGPTYELLRGRPFASFRKRLLIIRDLAPFGINFVVNAATVADLDRALYLADEAGAVEFLLLPEQPVRGRGGIDECTDTAMRTWVNSYGGSLRLSISESTARDLPFCDPLSGEGGLRAYAHIDASGVLKRSSYDQYGVTIGGFGVMQALTELGLQTGGAR